MTGAGPDPRPRMTEAGGLAGARCEACGYAVAFPRPRCPRCRGELAPAEFGPGGTVWASTVVHVPVPGVEPPYGLAYVDLDDDGPRVLVHTGGEAPLPVGARAELAAPDSLGNLRAR